MAKLRALSGKDLLRIFDAFGFVVYSQNGSHIKIRRVLPSGVRQSLTVVNHSSVDRGTLLGIYRQALRHIAESSLRPHFYTD